MRVDEILKLITKMNGILDGVNVSSFLMWSESQLHATIYGLLEASFVEILFI